MEINAVIYAMAKSSDLLGQAGKLLKAEAYQDYYCTETMEPCSVLPLSCTWYALSMRAEPARGPEEWMACLQECGRILGKDGAVVVEYRSPDHPDDYLEYAYTTARGGAGHSESLSPVNGYDRALGCRDISLVLSELMSGRTAQERFYASGRKEKKEVLRREKGDFESSGDGVLLKYRGNDTDVVIPDGVKEIGESAFVDLKGVERMIMECEDYDAPPMETLTIPESVEKIGFYAFAYCSNLREVEMTDHVKMIGERAFEGCESLKKIRLSSGLTGIEDSTFFLCDSLKSVVIPEGVEYIGNSAFLDCLSLNRVQLPASLKSIGDEAFKGTALKKVNIPDGVVKIGKNAFPFSD